MRTITGIAQVELSVSDLDRSSAWYCRVVGAREVFRAADEAAGLAACAIVEPSTRTVIAFTRHRGGDDSASRRDAGGGPRRLRGRRPRALDDWLARLDELGIEHGGIADYGYAEAITFKDPDGIALELFCQPRPS